MSPQPDKAKLDRLAADNGLAVAIVRGKEQLGASNDNSICRTLNPDSVFVGLCAAFCGVATAEIEKAGGGVSYRCHAGLECRAMPIGNGRAAIVGRAFVKAEDYRRATTRAVSGDWKGLSPAGLFENVLLTTSSEIIDTAAKKIAKIAATDIPVTTKKVRKDMVSAIPEPLAAIPQPEPSDSPAREDNKAGRSAWRSFFGSLLSSDYEAARRSLVEFITRHFKFTGLIWLERQSGRLEAVGGSGNLSGRRVRLSISANDPRVVKCIQSEMPLELTETGSGARRMSLFPLAVGGDVFAAIATLDPIESEEVKHHIARICLSVASQFEILRLRTEVERRERFSTAARRIGESIKTIDEDDFWLQLTQNAAEMFEAERASILLYDDVADEFQLKAIIGARKKFDPGQGIGERVARAVIARGAPAVVADVERSGLPRDTEGRNYKRPSFMSCPVEIGDHTIGVINFADHANGQPFGRKSLELYQAIAPQLAVAVDRARLKEKAGEFEQLSVTDALTGLLNRRYIEQRLNEEVKRSNRHGLAMSFMMLDVDNFKSYNDTFGHPAGDEALKLVGTVIRDTLRAADVAARFGGEEFAILLPQTMPEEAATIAERIRQNVANTEFPNRQVTLSIGVASCSADLCSSANIVSAADKALYRAKDGGRNRVTTFEEMGTEEIGTAQIG
jgi:diguanylate cyclase (GGDEF)-like protein